MNDETKDALRSAIVRAVKELPMGLGDTMPAQLTAQAILAALAPFLPQADERPPGCAEPTAERILTLVRENLGSVETSTEAISEMLNSPALHEMVADLIWQYFAPKHALTASAQRVAELERERDELREWKRQQLLVESTWDAQAVGKLIGCQLGDDIRRHIEPAIACYKAELAALKSRAQPTEKP